MRKSDEMKKAWAVYIALLFLRLFWLVMKEPQGAQRMIANHPGDIIAVSVYYSVFTSIVVLVIIIVFSLLRRRWAYLLGAIFGIAHFIPTVGLVIFRYNPGMGPFFVLPVCVLMTIFGFYAYKQARKPDAA